MCILFDNEYDNWNDCYNIPYQYNLLKIIFRNTNYDYSKIGLLNYLYAFNGIKSNILKEYIDVHFNQKLFLEDLIEDGVYDNYYMKKIISYFKSEDVINTLFTNRK